MLINTLHTYIDFIIKLTKHKTYVFKECYNEGLYWQGIIHDLSKLLPSEFFAYAHKFCWPQKRTKTEEQEADKRYSKASLLHRKRNPHHWDYWVVDSRESIAMEMPDKYLLEMICDWRAIGKVLNNSAAEFYQNNKEHIVLHEETRKRLESIVSGYQ